MFIMGLKDSPFVQNLGVSALNIGQSLFNNYLAEKSAEKQYQRQLDFWEKQNKYNAPSAQRARVEAAGFNPASDQAAQYAGASNSQGLEDVPGNEFAQSGVFDMSSFFANLESLSRMKKNGADVDLLEQQVKLAMVDYIIKNEEAFGLKLDNQKKETLLKYVDKEGELTIAKLLAEIDNIESSTKVNVATESKTVAETGLIGEQTETEQSKQDLMALQQAQVAAETLYTQLQSDNYVKEVTARINNINADTRNKLAELDVLYERWRETRANADLAELEANLKYWDSEWSSILGVDIQSLPVPVRFYAAQKLLEASDSKDPDAAYDVALKDIYNVIELYIDSETAILTSGSESTSIKLGPISESKSSSSTQNVSRGAEKYPKRHSFF